MIIPDEGRFIIPQLTYDTLSGAYRLTTCGLSSPTLRLERRCGRHLCCKTLFILNDDATRGIKIVCVSIENHPCHSFLTVRGTKRQPVSSCTQPVVASFSNWVQQQDVYKLRTTNHAAFQTIKTRYVA
jgi:hypothetical protein